VIDAVFFIAAKTIGRLAQVESWLVILLVLALWSGWRGRRRAAMILTALPLALLAGLSAFPLANPLMAALEMRYPDAPPLTHVDGIIVLGGAEDLGPLARWGGLQLNSAGERVMAGIELARRFPGAKLIYTGGTAGLIGNPNPGAPSRMVTEFWTRMGIPPAQIVAEGRSRDTAENASFTRDLIAPQPGQVFVLVTSAFHMPRAMDTFERAGWSGLVAWPVDFRSTRRTFGFDWRLDRHLEQANLALKEFVGQLAYYLAGRA
jgi:uncharacterized SAM-binding protein YcdF (DUF218 family)